LLIDGILHAAVNSPLCNEKRGGTVVVDFDDMQRTNQLLIESGVYFDHRISGFRFSPHIYNTHEDVMMLLQILNNIKLHAVND